MKQTSTNYILSQKLTTMFLLITVIPYHNSVYGFLQLLADKKRQKTFQQMTNNYSTGCATALPCKSLITISATFHC